jgi:hypothetical protein
MSNDETLLRDTLKDLLAEDCKPDASDLVLLAMCDPAYCGPRLDQSRRAELRTIAVSLLDEAGYCACGQPKVSGRCPLCGRVR